MSEAILTSDLSFSYESRLILEKVNLEIERGEFIGIVGPNGGGKSTLLKLLMGFLSPTEGLVLLNGKLPYKMRKKIGYVPQSLQVDRDFPITVRELVLLGGLENTLFYSKKVVQKAERLIEELGLKSFANEPFSTLSGGYAQRALLARAELSDPEHLFLDEPTANVDAASSHAIFKRLESYKGKKTILLITHDLKTVLKRVDRILCVEKKITSLFPKEVCEHFALGLYHTPLMDLPENHFGKEANVPHCVL